MTNYRKYGENASYHIPRIAFGISLLAILLLVGGASAAINGLNARYYATSIYENDQWNKTGTPTATQIDPNINFSWQPSGTDPRPAGIGSGDFSADWNGYIDIPTDGNYTFATTSDDGSIVYIDNNVVVNNGGAHRSTPVAGDPVTLTKGLHPITVKYYECCGDGSSITLYWTVPGGSEEIVPPSALFPTPVTTPPTVHITANPPTHDINVSTNFTFTANPVGSWGNNISYSWSVAYEKCATAGLEITGQTISQNLDVACGNATISVTAEDENRNNASDTYLVTVHENATPVPPPVSTFNISGFKINNATGSGVQGWNITLLNSTMQMSMLTGADGSYEFMNLVNGTYNVAEETKAGWTSVSPMSQQVTINGADMMNVNFTNQPPSPTVTPVLTTITVSPSTAVLNVTETQLFTATALDQNNTPMSGINISWTISNSTVGSVTPLFAVTGMDGNASTTFTASAAGTTTVTATNGTVSGSSDVTVAAVTPTPIPPTPVPITPIPPVLGLKTQPTVVLIPPTGKVGDPVQGLGSGWPPLQRVDVFWDGNSFASKQVASNVPTNGNGGFIAYFKVPEGANPGSHVVRFTMQGMEPPITVDKTFQVRSTISPVPITPVVTPPLPPPEPIPGFSDCLAKIGQGKVTECKGLLGGLGRFIQGQFPKFLCQLEGDLPRKEFAEYCRSQGTPQNPSKPLFP